MNDQQSTRPLERSMAFVEKSQQLAGHFPNDEALDRARRIITGETTPEEARAELERKWGPYRDRRG